MTSAMTSCGRSSYFRFTANSEICWEMVLGISISFVGPELAPDMRLRAASYPPTFFFKIPLISGCLIKTKLTLPQVDLSEEKRKENLKGAFLVKDERMIRDKKILLIDDVFTTGATLKECAMTLRKAGAREIVGVVVARG